MELAIFPVWSKFGGAIAVQRELNSVDGSKSQESELEIHDDKQAANLGSRAAKSRLS